jgi:hypothetical protein
MSLLQNEE